MIPLSPSLLGAAGAAVLAGVLGGYGYIQTKRLDSCKEEHSRFVAQVEILGKSQAEKAREADAANQSRKEQADAEINRKKRDLDNLYSAYSSLRNSRSYSSPVPPASPAAKDPDSACFDRKTLDRRLADADGILQEGAIAILHRGDEAIAQIESLKTWAASR